MSQRIIYGLVDPRTKAVRYIGKSTTGLTRPKQHGHAAQLRRSPGHRTNWILSLRRERLDYEIIILMAVGPRLDLDEEERGWIKLARQLGWPLTNHTDGGDGSAGLKHTAETKAKMSAAHKGQPARGVATSGGAIWRGRKHSEASKEKMRVANTGKFPSPETRELLRQRKLGVAKSKKHREAIRLASLNRPAAHNERIAAGQRAAWAKRKRADPKADPLND